MIKEYLMPIVIDIRVYLMGWVPFLRNPRQHVMGWLPFFRKRKPQDNFDIILVEAKDEGSIGAVARVMNNFGYKKLVLVDPPQIGLLAKRRSVTAHNQLKKADFADSFDKVKGNYELLVGITLKNEFSEKKIETTFLQDSDLKIALVFCEEDYPGLGEVIGKCDRVLSIPAYPQYPPLTLEDTLGIVLYEITKNVNKKYFSAEKFTKPSNEEKDTIISAYGEVVDSTYKGGSDGDYAKKTFHQIVDRAFISKRECETLTGVFQKIMGRLKR